MTDQELVRLHATVEGRVQGVGFRYFAQERAARLNLVGWVRNRWQGTVEVVAEGPQEQVDKLLQAIGRGPNARTTKNVKYAFQEATGEFSTFQIRRTG